jgi:hypothetical protein
MSAPSLKSARRQAQLWPSIGAHMTHPAQTCYSHAGLTRVPGAPERGERLTVRVRPDLSRSVNARTACFRSAVNNTGVTWKIGCVPRRTAAGAVRREDGVIAAPKDSGPSNADASSQPEGEARKASTMHDEWTKAISGDRLVKFTLLEPPEGEAFLTADWRSRSHLLGPFATGGRPVQP